MDKLCLMKLIPHLNIKAKLRDTVSAFAEMAGSVIQVAVPGSGSAICFAVGKVVVGLILAAITLAVVMRLLWRRKHADRVRSSQRLPVWCKLVAILSALTVSAALVEMTKLPVRFDQPNFEIYHWLLVIISIVLFYSWGLSILRAWLNRSSVMQRQP